MGTKKKDHRKERQQRNEDDIENDNVQKQEKSDEEEPTKQQNVRKGSTDKKFQIVPPKKVQYCHICTLPFELCRYGKTVNACIKFLYDLAPTKVSKYHPQFKQEDITTIKKQLKEIKKQQAAKQQKDKKQKTVKQKYVVIDTKNRGKKNYVTTISGLNIFGVDAKQFSKKISKKFACSCSAIEQGVSQLQGQFFEEIKEILIMEYKVKKKYIIDGQQYKVKFNEEMQKKKQAKKNKDGAIIEDPNEDQEEIKQTKIQEVEVKPQEVPVIEEKPKNRLGFQIRSDSEDDE